MILEKKALSIVNFGLLWRSSFGVRVFSLTPDVVELGHYIRFGSGGRSRRLSGGARCDQGGGSFPVALGSRDEVCQ